MYVSEHDRQMKRQGHQAHAPPWWDFFHFQLFCLLIDDADGSIFGAIYELKSFACNFTCSFQKAPKYVIAFRGTIRKRESILRDVKLDILCLCNKLQQSSRFQVAMQALQHILHLAGASNIWLTGHSLGSAIALLGGKNMTKLGYPIETYLFNPPFFSAPLEKMKSEKLKHGIHFTSSVVKAGLAVAVKGRHQKPQQDDTFVALSSWFPYLFVNPKDPICSEYIGYFQHRKKMEERGAGHIERLATQNSVGSLLLGALGMDSEPLHLIPSAHLTVNLNEPSNFKQAHGIHQWWNSNFKFEYNVHQFM